MEKEKVQELTFDKIKPLKFYSVKDKNPEETDSPRYVLKTLGNDIIEVGTKENSPLAPYVKLNKWDEECSISVSLPTTASTNSLQSEGNKLKWIEEKREAHFYPQNDNEFEFEIILKEKPATNIVSLNIESKGLDFFYQPALTLADNPEADYCIDTACYKDNATTTYRPENVVGSYAVYHSTKQGDYSKMGGKNYRAGKAFHVYRPKIIDSAGAEVWGRLNINEQTGVLTVEIPQEFLDNAVYPVRHAAGLTFGYTDIGDGLMTYYNNYIDGFYSFSPVSDGTVSKISFYGKETTAGGKLRPIIYKTSDDSRICYGNEIDAPTSAQWNNMSLSGSVVASTDYMLSIWFGAQHFQFSYDSIAGYHIADEYETYHSTNPPPATCGWDGGKPYQADWKVSIYCTYTATGPTYTLATTTGQTFTINNNLTIGNALDVMSVTGATHNPIIDVGGNVTITASSTLIAATSSAFTVGGSWSNTGTFTHSTSTVTFDATASGKTITAGGSSFSSITFNGSGGEWTLQDALDVNNAFNLTNGTLAQAADNNINIAGNVAIAAGGVFTKAGGTGKVIFDGDLTYQDADEDQNLGNLEIGTSPDTTDLSSDLVADSLTVQSGDTLNTNGYELDITNNITINGTLDATDDGELDGCQINLGGSWDSSSGTFTCATSTVVFDSADAGETVNSGSSDFYNLTFNNGSGGWTFSAAATTTNDFTITNGSVTSTSATLTVGGSYSNSGTFTHNSGTVTFDATASGKTITDGGSAFHLLNFNGAGGEWLYKDGCSTAPATTTIQAGTPTFLNAKTGNTSVTGGTLNTDWYLGAHVVNKDATSTDIDTGDNDITISAAAPWYNSSWSYRKSIPISNTTSTQTDYQVKIEVATSTGGDVTCDGHCQDDFDDVRFTTSNGTTLIDYWREDYTTSSTSTFWAEIPTLTGSATTTIYMYYGNASATTTSNGTSTFAFFDDFESYSIGSIDGQGDWSITTGSSSVSVQNGRNHLRMGAGVTDGVHAPVDTDNQGYAIMAKVYSSDCDESFQIAYSDGLSTSYDPYNGYAIYHRINVNRERLMEYNDGVRLEEQWPYITPNTISSTYYIFELDWYNAGTLDFKIDGNSRRTETDTTFSSFTYIHFTGHHDATWYVDEVFVRKYASPEPSIGTTGSEETSVPATIWKYNSGWGTASTTQTTGSGADGKTPQPTTDGAIRIREYSKTSSATTTYKYNLAVSSQSGFGAYNYYSDQGSNYITSASSTESSGVDKCISDSWHRNSAGTMNTPYSAVDDPPTNGSWYIGMTSNITVSGTVYQTEGGSNIGADKSILLKVDGAGSWSASTTAGGVYEITSITGISAGSTITAWISGDATYKGTAVTIANNGSSNITGFDIYGGAVIARSDKTSTALTIADMVDYDKDDDSDIHFTATTSPSASLIVDNDSELHIWIGKEFAPGGNVTLTHGGAKGDLHIDGSATFTGSTTSTYSIGGSWTASSTAVFTAASSTVQFTATTTGKTITTGGSDFYDLTFDGSGGGWTFQDAATTTNDLTITTGAVTSTSGTLAIGGSWSNAGTFTHNSGTVLFNATASGKTITTGGSDFYDLTFDGSGGVWDFQDAATTTNDLTITDGTLDLNGQNLVVQGGDISVSGILAADVDSGAVSLSGEGNLGGSGTTTVYDISFSGTTTLAGGIDVNNDLTISGSNSLDASSSNYAITVGGSWSNSGTFTAQSGAVTFDSGDAGETIDPGSSSFFDVNFNNTAGGWTISENATSTHNWQLANGTSFTVASGKTIEAQGRFFNGVGGSTTTWTGSTLDLNSLKGNSSLDFDGDNDYVDCGDGSSLLMGSGNFTVSAWIKATSGGDGWIVVKGSGWSGGKRYGIAFTTDGGRSDGTIKVAIDDNSTRKNVFSTSQYADGEWHFVAAMRDGDNLRLYIDGSEDANSPTDISGYSSLDNNRICSIGAIYNEDTSAMAQYFNGAIDEVRIYNRALSSTEINEHYQGLFKNETGLVGLWHFAEGTGTTTADSSGQGNNGTLKPTASEPTWVTDAPLYTINSTSTGADIYSTLEVGASTDVRMWNSYSATSTVDSTGSLYSMDHDESGDGTGDDGKLFIWGDYHTISTTTDYWSYATDFDGTAGADRQCKVYVQQNATTTVDSGATLNVKGGGSSSGDITIVGQGASSLWDFACNGTCSVQESTWNYLNLSGGTLTVLNTTLNNEDPPDAGATLNVDWYLGAHVVDAAATSTDVDTGDNDITISAAAPWYNSSWSYREKITIDHTKVATSTQTNFPVLINSTSTDWKDTTNGGHVGQSDGGDILFTKADGSTKLDHEIEKYASSTGEVIAWIEVDSLSHSADTVLYMYYGNASSSDQWDITGTWNSNFKLVQHLQEYNAGENATHTDSTINSNDGTPNNFDGTSTSTQDGTGQIDGADVFDGSDDYISCEDDSSLNPDYVTVTFWFKPDSFIQNSGLIAKGDNTHRQYWIWLFNSKVYVEIDEGGYDDVTAVLTVDDWYHFAVKYNGSRVVAYLNGDESSQSYDQSTGTILQDDDALWIGALPGFSKFDGTIDEVRVSDTARSGDWIKTSYDNQNSPSTFYSVGSEETSVPATIWKYNSGWGSASTTQTTGSGADGKTPQPNTDGAVRIREYSKTSSATTTYKYNLAIAFGGFDNYDYYSDYGSNYIISASSTAGSGVDKCISENWQRDDISALNTPYSAVNDPPTNGSWYIGMSSDLEFSVSSATTDLGTLNSINDYTATGTTILYATTSYSGGYNITAWASDNGRLQLGATGTYITRWNYANSTPAVWPDTCNASSTCGFGYTTSDNNLGGGGSVDRFAASTKYAGFATTTPGDRVADSAAPASGATTTIMYRTSVSSIQSNGDYSVTIHYICTANY
ncbi:DUF2341 domain-containing protein [Candidatus Parcubacteria bacterium]|nr:DUF2341 domain-containing protein [Candidatus Parcubacteria bacterium]